MIGYIAPPVPLLPNPVGLDKAIQDIQVALRNIDWLGNFAFGRAFKQEQTKIVIGQRKLVYYPEVYQANMEPLIVMPNDNLPACSFFYTKDPGKTIDYQSSQQNIFTYPTSLVVWVNLNKVDETKSYRFTEVLKLQILRVLNVNTNIIVNQIFESYENVFSNYTITEDYREYMKMPFSAFRVDFDLSFREILPGC